MKDWLMFGIMLAICFLGIQCDIFFKKHLHNQQHIINNQQVLMQQLAEPFDTTLKTIYPKVNKERSEAE